MKLDPEETILVTKEDYDRLVEACKTPPDPTDYFIELAKRYKERVKDETKTQDT
jgi:uncharacterized protein (DUF1778 family)